MDYTELSWSQLYDKYQDIGLGSPNGQFSSTKFEEYSSSSGRQFHCEPSCYWGPRGSNSKAGQTQGVLKIAPYDDQWMEGYAFSLYDGRRFDLSAAKEVKEFVRQIPSPQRRRVPRDADHYNNSDGRGVFPCWSSIFTPKHGNNLAEFRQLRNVSDNPKIEQMSSQIEIDPEPWQIGVCRECGSKKPWEENQQGGLSCIECGLVVRDYSDEKDVPMGEGGLKQNQAQEHDDKNLKNVPKSGQIVKNLPSTRPTVSSIANKILDDKGGLLKPQNCQAIQGLMSTTKWILIQDYIHQRLEKGSKPKKESKIKDSEYQKRMDDWRKHNAWVAWQFYDKKKNPYFDARHFTLAAWIWGLQNKDKLDNELFNDLHCAMLDIEGNSWTPMDVLMVVEILRLMWWEIKGEGDFQWTAYPHI